MVRAKFRLNSYTTEVHETYPHEMEDGSGRLDYSRPATFEKRTLNFTLVTADARSPENKAFWEASPTGSLQLGTVNQAAWQHFEIGKEYYLDFSPA